MPSSIVYRHEQLAFHHTVGEVEKNPISPGEQVLSA